MLNEVWKGLDRLIRCRYRGPKKIRESCVCGKQNVNPFLFFSLGVFIYRPSLTRYGHLLGSYPNRMVILVLVLGLQTDNKIFDFIRDSI
jgi:hypothetical protein